MSTFNKFKIYEASLKSPPALFIDGRPPTAGRDSKAGFLSIWELADNV